MCYLTSTGMMGGHMGQQQHLQQQQQQQQPSNNIGSNYMQQGNGADPHQQPVGPPPPPVQQAQPVQTPSPSLHCIRQGCPNPAIVNSEWEDEYCSNECVVSHCRDVFSTWVASSQQPVQPNFSTVT